jgi:5-formyltetrahydrofolate cyclo-ligase
VQVVEKLPRDVWDQTVDIVISEARVLHGDTVSDAGRGAR